MNPRGRQYALGGTVHGWVELEELTPAQRRALRRIYRGRHPLLFSRYGRRQWAAPLPWTRLVVKDPFAMLSVPIICEVTGAVPVLVYRHPGAALVSYRRMGWAPDLDELAPVLERHRRYRGRPEVSHLRDPGLSAAAAMGRFWAALYELALDNLDSVVTFTVSHEEVAGGGPSAARVLFRALGLEWSTAAEAEMSRAAGRVAAPGTLHAFNRPPAEVAGAWRKDVTPDELVELESAAGQVLARLEASRLPLGWVDS
jgi:hypothetical protein